MNELLLVHLEVLLKAESMTSTTKVLVDDEELKGSSSSNSPRLRQPSVSSSTKYAAVGSALACMSAFSVLFSRQAGLCSDRSLPLSSAFVAAFAAGSFATVSAAIFLVLGLRGAAFWWATDFLTPLDLLPAGIKDSAGGRVRGRREQQRRGRGDIALIGAGSGAVSQLTLEAFAALQAAEVVICDRVLPVQLHSAVPAGAVLRIADKIPGHADAAQAELYAWGINALKEGRRVVRLKVRSAFCLCFCACPFSYFPLHVQLCPSDRSATLSYTAGVERRSYFTDRR